MCYEPRPSTSGVTTSYPVSGGPSDIISKQLSSFPLPEAIPGLSQVLYSLYFYTFLNHLTRVKWVPTLPYVSLMKFGGTGP